MGNTKQKLLIITIGIVVLGSIIFKCGIPQNKILFHPSTKIFKGCHPERNNIYFKGYNSSILHGWLFNRHNSENKKVILFCHFPVFPDNAHNLWNCEDVLSLIDKHKSVKAYFNGHDHRGHYAERDGVHYITMRGMVEKEVETGFAINRVFPIWLNIDGFGEEPSRMLSIR